MNTVSPGKLCNSIVPSCARTTAEAMARPSPVEPPLRDREVSPRAKRSKTSDCSADGMPGPLSATRRTAESRSALSDKVTDVPGGVWTRAFASRLATAWCSRASSPVT